MPGSPRALLPPSRGKRAGFLVGRSIFALVRSMLGAIREEICVRLETKGLIELFRLNRKVCITDSL